MEAVNKGVLRGPPRSQLWTKRPRKYHGLGEGGISLGLAEIDFDAPDLVEKAVIDAVINGEYHYADVKGLPEFLQAVVNRCEKYNHMNIEAENVLPTVGAMNGIWLTSRAVLKPEDEVIIASPIYGPIFGHMASAGARVIVCPARGDGYHLDLDDIEKRISKQTKMIVICNPNNPTGAVYTKSELEGLADVARRKKIYVFSDELYDTLTYDGRRHVSIASFSGMEDLTITVNGFSKTYGMSGLRIGYAVANKKIIDRMRKLNGPIVIQPGTIEQKAAAVALNECDEWMRCFRSHCEKMRNILCDALDRLENVSCPRPEGTFFAFPDLSKVFKNDREAASLLEGEYNIRTSSGSGYGKGGEGHLRLVFATTQEIIQEAALRISTAITKFADNW
ncbi:MAG: pyridoxal phosphate-dependent aminotransferase [Candidatus Bathyarchaeia archaeon]